jgi:hypothetical protein
MGYSRIPHLQYLMSDGQLVDTITNCPPGIRVELRLPTVKCRIHRRDFGLSFTKTLSGSVAVPSRGDFHTVVSASDVPKEDPMTEGRRFHSALRSSTSGLGVEEHRGQLYLSGQVRLVLPAQSLVLLSVEVKFHFFVRPFLFDPPTSPPPFDRRDPTGWGSSFISSWLPCRKSVPSSIPSFSPSTCRRCQCGVQHLVAGPKSPLLPAPC